jgi:hypothetical protein
MTSMNTEHTEKHHTHHTHHTHTHATHTHTPHTHTRHTHTPHTHTHHTHTHTTHTHHTPTHTHTPKHTLETRRSYIPYLLAKFAYFFSSLAAEKSGCVKYADFFTIFAIYNCTILLTITPRATTAYFQGQAAVFKYGI